MTRFTGLAVFFLAALLLAWPAQAEPRVVVSIAPLQSLAAAVMEGAGTPDLLLEGLASPHGYSLKPSQALKIRQADLVVWVGPELESFLAKPVAALADKGKTLAMSDVAGMTLLPAREGGVWEPHADEHDHKANALETDGHLWLDTGNAALFAGVLAERLAALDAAHADLYRHNAAKLKADLAKLDGELKAQLAPLAGLPYIVFHDAYHYFERRYGLTPAGSITVDPERKPSAQTIARLRAKISRLKAACVFREPQYSPALAETVAEGLAVRIGSLDGLGSNLAPGPELYADSLKALAASLRGCMAHDR